MYPLLESCNGGTIKASELSLTKCEVNPEPYPVVAGIFSDFHETKYFHARHHLLFLWFVKGCATHHVAYDNNLS